MTQRQRDSWVAIVGGGITGLAAAWELQQRGIPYILLESADRLGGKILTERIDGFVIEAAADSFLVQKPWAWQLCLELGLQDRLIGTNEAQRTVYVLKDGNLHPTPRGMRLIVPLDRDGLLESDLLSDEGKQRMLAEVDVAPRAALSESSSRSSSESSSEIEDESLASFVRRRFGVEALTIFGDSLLAGIHVSDPERLSMQAAFPNYVQLERLYGSVIRGMQIQAAERQASAQPLPANVPRTAFVSLRNGVYELIETLATALTGEIRTGQAAQRLDADGTLHLSNGDSLRPAAIIVTTPAAAAHVLVGDAVTDAGLALQPLRTSSSATVSFGFRREQVDHPLDGTGFVVPRGEARILASTWSSTKLAYRAPDGYVLIRVFFGGYEYPDDPSLPDDVLIAHGRAELQRIMGIDAEPVISRVFRWQNANPQYDVGHVQRMHQLANACPPWLAITGCSYGGVGVPDCVRQGREAARQVVEGRA